MLDLLPRASSTFQPRSAAVIGAPLAALDGQRFTHRFQVWRTVEGERLVCTVFAAEDEGAADCHDVSDTAVVIGVGLDRFGLCRALIVLGPEDVGPCGLAQARERHPLIREWHVHLLAATPADAHRRAEGLRAAMRL